jgi:hypothetical protein
VREKNTLHDLKYPCVKKLIDEFFQRGIDGVQALDVRAAGKTIRDLVKVIDFHPSIPVFFRIEDDVGSLLAGPETHVGFYFDIGEPFSFNSLLKFGHELLRASILAIHVLTDETKRFHKPLLVADGIIWVPNSFVSE